MNKNLSTVAESEVLVYTTWIGLVNVGIDWFAWEGLLVELSAIIDSSTESISG